MSKYRVPDEEEKRILREIGVEPNSVTVSFQTENEIHLLRFKTRDEIEIEKQRQPIDLQARSIIEENGIDPNSVVLVFLTERSIHLLHKETFRKIVIRKGCRPWT